MKSLFSKVSKNSVRNRIIEFRKMLNTIKLGYHSFYRILQQKEKMLQKKKSLFFKF